MGTTADALPAGYDPRGALFPEAFPYGRPQWTTLGGGGNLASTGDDMLAWLAYNMGHDVALPGSTGPKLPFLMYTNAETGGQRLDQLDPDSLGYSITAWDVKA